MAADVGARVQRVWKRMSRGVRSTAVKYPHEASCVVAWTERQLGACDFKSFLWQYLEQ